MNIDRPRLLEAFEMLYEPEKGGFYYPKLYWIPTELAQMSDADILALRDRLKSEPGHLVHASVEREVGNFLYWLARMVGAKRVLETGANQGYSTSMLACAVRDNSGTEVVSIDINKNAFIYKNTELNSFVTFLHGSSLEVPVHGPFDMMLLDSDHTYGTIMQEIVRFDSMLREGGLMCFHDSLCFDGIGIAIRQMRETGRYEMVNLDSPGKSNPFRCPGVTVARKLRSATISDLKYDDRLAEARVNITPDRAKSRTAIVDMDEFQAPYSTSTT